jgi:hypothetical protein
MTAVPVRARPPKSSSKSSSKPPKVAAKAKTKSNGWGGKRKGAGRKLTPGRLPSAPHRVRVLNVGRHPILVTMRALPEIPSLRGARVRALFAAVLDDQRSRPYAKGFAVTAHAAMEKELRLIVEGTSSKAQSALRAGMSGLFIAFARRLNILLGRKGKVWSDRWDGRELSTPQEVREAMATLEKPTKPAVGRAPGKGAKATKGAKA